MRSLLILLILVTSCGTHKSHRSTSALERLQARRDAYTAQKVAYKHRCDKLTFRALLSAFGPRQAIEEHEYVPGQFHRDVTPCYPSDSRSEISLDGYISVGHHIYTYNDREMLGRVIEYGREHKWIMGDGPTEYTNIYALVPILYKLRDTYELNTYTDILQGYKGHVALMLLLLKARVYGYLNNLEYSVLKQIYLSNPSNPLYSAVYHRYTDGDYTEVLNILEGIEDVSGTATWGWGSAPDVIVFITTVGIIEDR